VSAPLVARSVSSPPAPFSSSLPLVPVSVSLPDPPRTRSTSVRTSSPSLAPSFATLSIVTLIALERVV
jgi:hypothetical protein